MLFHVKGVFRVCVGQVLVFRVLRDGGQGRLQFQQAGLDISPIITHHFDIRDYEKGFEAMISGQSGKVILDWAHIND